MNMDCSEIADRLSVDDAGNGIVIIAECEGGRITPVTGEAIRFARLLIGGSDKEEIVIVIPGRNIMRAAGTFAETTGLPVIGMESDTLDPYCAEAFQQALIPVISSLAPRFVCLAHTAIGSDYAPGLAVGLNTACITAITKISGEDSERVYQRAAFKGKWCMSVAPIQRRAVLTIQPGAFPASEEGSAVKGRVETIRPDITLLWTKTGEVTPSSQASRELGEAEVIVGAGRGIGAEENVSLMRKLAGLFPKSAVGGSRTVCDLGWLPYSLQIGITGKTVSPQLYIACGISGSIQHVSGIAGARYIAAINRDPQAPIFQIADWGIVEDLTTFIPLILECYDKMKGSHTGEDKT
ncbi:MAG: electron transfer flavoprotein subunit alpha/FixB family protein [Syntrophales bacterium]|jgi:electron transfer flavoprotein alpha subunit